MQGQNIDHDRKVLADATQNIMRHALQATSAAQELALAGPESQLSTDTLDMLEKYRRMTGSEAVRTYMHPTAAAIADDDATADFAAICAVRALKDALGATALTEEGRRKAVASLLTELGTVEQVERAIADVRRLKMVKVPFHKGMRVLTKALYLAAHHAREGKALPTEGADFLQHAAQLVDQILSPEQSTTHHVTEAIRLRGSNPGLSHVTTPASTPASA